MKKSLNTWGYSKISSFWHQNIALTLTSVKKLIVSKTAKLFTAEQVSVSYSKYLGNCTFNLGFPGVWFNPPLCKWNHNGNVAQSVKFIRLWTFILWGKWIQKVKEETAFTIGSGNLIPSKKAGWLHLKLTGKRPCANAAIEWSIFQTHESLHLNRTWKVKCTKKTVELEVNRLWHYPHLVLNHVEMEILYHVGIVPVEMDSLNIVINPWKVLEKSLNKRSSKLYEPWFMNRYFFIQCSFSIVFVAEFVQSSVTHH